MVERAFGRLEKDVVETIVLHTEDICIDCKNGLGNPIHKTIHEDIDHISVCYFGGKSAAFFTIDGTTPVFLGNDQYVCPNGNTVTIPVSGHEVTVKLITEDTGGMYGVGVCRW